MSKMDAQAVESTVANPFAPTAGAQVQRADVEGLNLGGAIPQKAPGKSHARRLGGSCGQQACRRRCIFRAARC